MNAKPAGGSIIQRYQLVLVLVIPVEFAGASEKRETDKFPPVDTEPNVIVEIPVDPLTVTGMSVPVVTAGTEATFGVVKEIVDESGKKYITLTDKGFLYLEKYKYIQGFIEEFEL